MKEILIVVDIQKVYSSRKTADRREWLKNKGFDEKTTKVKSQKATPESALLSISLEELNLEKYCDITQLTKFNEQMLVVMLMYTKEKGIEYFSYNDIVSVFKTKFKIPATDRKVRYAFDNGGTMFDKKVEKKIAYHKLMNGGIKEAERIVERQKVDAVL